MEKEGREERNLVKYQNKVKDTMNFCWNAPSNKELVPTGTKKKRE